MTVCDNHPDVRAAYRVTVTDGQEVKARNLCRNCMTVAMFHWNSRPTRPGENLAVEPIENWESKIV